MSLMEHKGPNRLIFNSTVIELHMPSLIEYEHYFPNAAFQNILLSSATLVILLLGILQCTAKRIDDHVVVASLSWITLNGV